MAVIDPTSDIGKLRLRCGDYSDLPIFPDEVYESVIEEVGGNLPSAAALMAQYILGALTAKTHKRLAQVEIWGDEWFDNYVRFLKMTVLNPNLMQVSPVPYIGGNGDQSDNPLIAFQEEWNKCYKSNHERF